MELGVSSHIRQECACYMSQHWRIFGGQYDRAWKLCNGVPSLMT